MIRAAAKNHAYAVPVVAPATTTRCSRSCASSSGELSLATRESSPPRRSPTPRATTRRSRAGSPSGATTSRRCSRARTRRSSTSLRREPAPARRLLRQVGRRAHVLSHVRQHRASSSRTTTCSTSTPRACSSREFEGPACVIVKHNNPCGVALGATALEAYERRSRATRSRVRRHHRAQPPGRRGARRGARGAVPRGAVRARLRRRRARDARREANLRVLAERRAPRAALARARVKQVTGGLLVQDRDSGAQERGEMEVATRASRPSGVERAAVRLARLQARELERDRARAGRRLGRHRRRADEPRRLGADRGREGARREPARWRARRSPRTRSSRSPTGRRPRSTRASPRSSSRAARCATPR